MQNVGGFQQDLPIEKYAACVAFIKQACADSTGTNPSGMSAVGQGSQIAAQPVMQMSPSPRAIRAAHIARLYSPRASSGDTASQNVRSPNRSSGARTVCSMSSIQGSVTCGATTGLLRLFAEYRIAFSRNVELVASWN